MTAQSESQTDGGDRRRFLGRPPWVVAVVGVLLVAGAGLIGVSVLGQRGSGQPTTITPTGPRGPIGDSTAEPGEPAEDGWVPTDGTPGSTAPMPDGLGLGWAPERDGRTPRQGFGEAWLRITAEDGTVCEVCALAAVSSAQRSRGLMEVTDADLGGYDAMVFAFEEDTFGGFWMKDTPLPLSIAWFDGSGVLVDTADMEPCLEEPHCTSYPASGAFRYALEVPQGRLPEVGVVGAATLEVVADRCPPAGI